MAYVANKQRPLSPVGDGQCVKLVQYMADAPLTSEWRAGSKVRGNLFVSEGTAIATFDASGHYPNHSTGNHAAIYLRQDTTGIWVFEQWKGHAPSERHIRFKGGVGSPSNDGDQYSVIE